jgi:hypothetical protein
MPFSASLPFDGDAEKALDVARAALAGSGFVNELRLEALAGGEVTDGG